MNDSRPIKVGAPTPSASRSDGRLERLLRAGGFVVTAETTPPLSADPDAVLARAGCLNGVVDAINVNDGPGARAHLSTLATAAILARAGAEPILQMNVRDRNRLAMAGDLLGAAALGIPNILCLSGDDVAVGDQPETKMVHDLDSRGLMSLARSMRDDGALPSGRKIEAVPRLFIGGADTPHDPPPDWQPDGLRAKIAAGADFFQTQFCFDVAVARRYMARLVDSGITEQAYFLIGIGPLKSLKSATWMDQNLFGVTVPADTLRRLEQAADERAEGHRICVELLAQYQDMPGVSGCHLMGPNVEQDIADVVGAAGVTRDRPKA